MAKLKAKVRNSLSTDQFALPAERKFPIPDAAHAANAKARAAQSGDPSVKARVDAAVARRYPEMGKAKSKAKKG